MTREEIELFEDRLVEHGYKKITTCKVTQMDDFEYFKPFYCDDGESPIAYQIFFEFWDFTKYEDIPQEWDISLVILKGGLDRVDLKISSDWLIDIKKVEQIAEDFYEFCLRNI